MSIDIPEKGDKIFIKVAGQHEGTYCMVIDWDVEHGNQNWAVLSDGENKWQVNISQISNYSVMRKYAAAPKEYVIKHAKEEKQTKVAAKSSDAIRKYKIAKPVEPDPDPSSELKGITDPTLRAMKLADLRRQQQQSKMEDIKDHMTDPKPRITEHNYEMPRFKKRSG